MRVSALLHDARPVLLDFGRRAASTLGTWADRVRLVDARFDGAWELPVIERGAPSAVLIRPTGTCRVGGTGNLWGLTDALARWFGPPERRRTGPVTEEPADDA